MSNVGRVAAQAANTLTAPLNVEEVFSTYLYDGNATARSIVNGIDLAGEGGLVWIKARGAAYDNVLFDTERGANQWIRSNNTGASATYYSNTGLTSFNSDGFSLGTDPTGYYVNQSAGGGYASWTFRKAPKFFDVVTWTGNTGNRTIAHSLNGEVGMIVLKKTSATGDWYSYHRSLGNTKAIALNSTGAAISPVSFWQSTTPTSTEFYVNSDWNDNGQTYVAYLFAHNDGDGDFGSTADQDIIKCGSYSGDGTSNGTNVVTLGWEPQWLLIKNTTSADSWVVMDNMRGLVNGGGAVGADGVLFPDTSGSEAGWDLAHPTATGFTFTSAGGNVNQSGQTYIYIAIRRGPMAVPESATDVFDVTEQLVSRSVEVGTFPVDMSIAAYPDNAGNNRQVFDRLRGNSQTSSKYLQTNTTNAEASAGAGFGYDSSSGYIDNFNSVGYNQVYWNWKRAPSFFDVVAYTGNGVAGRTVSHNLGVAPEMIWVKRRNAVDGWIVYHSGLDLDGDGRPETDYAVLENGNLFDGTLWNDTAPTATEFTVGFQGAVNDTFNNNYIAYLFASLSGISKCGSYTGNGSSQTIDCGFSSGARFVLIKRSDLAGGYGTDWYVWDAERGIVSANDPHLSLNTTAAQVTTDDSIDPVSSGFAVNQVAATNINVSSASYIFYAIA